MIERIILGKFHRRTFLNFLLFAWLLQASSFAPRALAQAQTTTTRETIKSPPAENADPARTGSAEARFGLTFKPLDFKPPEVNHAQLANGISIDHYSEPAVPMVTVLVRLRVGSVNDPPGKVGAASMTADLIRTGGTGKIGGDALDRQLDEHGAEFSTETGREETWLRLSVLKEDLPWGMDLLAALLTGPAFPADKLEELRARSLVDIRQRFDTPQSIARHLFPQLIYGQGNPWGWIDTERTVKAIQVADLRAIYEKYYVSGNMKLGLAGDVDWPTARRLAEQTLGRIPRREAPPLALPKAAPVTASRVYTLAREATQNVIYFGHEGIQRFDPAKFPLKVFNEVLSGGFTSRLVKEIRSNRGLAYSVYGQIGEGTEKGIFSNVAYTKAPSTAEALTLMREVDQGLTREDPSAPETDLAKQSVINSFVFFFDKSEKIVRQKMTLDGFGYPPDYMATYVEKIKTVTPAEVRKAAAQALHLDRIIVLIVGQIGPELRKTLEAIGPIDEIKETALREKWM